MKLVPLSFIALGSMGISQLPATTLDFQLVPVAGPVSGTSNWTDPTPFLSTFGITVSNKTPGTLFGVIESDATIPAFQHVLNEYNGTDPETFTLNFASPVNDLVFVRQQYGNNNSGPAWTASALDSSGNALQTISEAAQPPGGSPTTTFAFIVSNIWGLRIDANDAARATWSGPPISSISYTPAPEPATIANFGIALGFLGLGGIARRLRRRS